MFLVLNNVWGVDLRNLLFVEVNMFFFERWITLGQRVRECVSVRPEDVTEVYKSAVEECC